MVDTIMSERRATLLFAPPGAELMKSKKGSNLLIFSLLPPHRGAENFFREGQRRKPAADDLRFFSGVEQLAPLRCTVLFADLT